MSSSLVFLSSIHPLYRCIPVTHTNVPYGTVVIIPSLAFTKRSFSSTFVTAVLVKTYGTKTEKKEKQKKETERDRMSFGNEIDKSREEYLDI